MTITRYEDGAYVGVVDSDMGKFNLENISIVDGKITSGFKLDGADFGLNGTFVGDTFYGYADFDGGRLVIRRQKKVDVVE